MMNALMPSVDFSPIAHTNRISERHDVNERLMESIVKTLSDFPIVLFGYRGIGYFLEWMRRNSLRIAFNLRRNSAVVL